MNQAIRIAQISDCHLPGDSKLAYRGVNAHKNLGSLLQTVKTFSPDLILATGDLSEDASPASYQALQTYFNSMGLPVLALPGNHDDADLLAEIFPGSPVESVTVSNHGVWQVIRLNSCVEGKPEGRLTERTLEQLEQQLLIEPHRPRLIALHHQPVPVGSPWIDKYCLFEPEAFLKLIDQIPGVKVVVWGHVHQVSDTRRGNIAMLGGPSSSINSAPGMLKFTADTMGPAYRWLVLEADGTIRNSIIAA
jgi:Icc protein